ncbi:MAG: RNA polymerase sigma factor [Candidatus Limivicinus sp.]|nr:RNA polymerase sigma factor [Candidatus Limivicinus sp.]
MTDASIIALYLKRSEQAIAESQNAYGRYCYRVAEGILNDVSDSEESVNDTWLAAWDSIPPTLPQSLRAYLGTLTRRISIDRLRKRRAEKRGGDGALLAIDELAECIPSSWSVEKTVEDRELIRAFNRFLAGLPEADRNLFVARYWYGLPVAEIARKFGCRQNTVLTKLRRTRLRLSAYLEQEGLQ